GDAECQRAARPALPDDRRDDRNGELAHLVKISGDSFRLAALLRSKPGPGALRVDESQNRDVEFLGELHQSERLAVTFRVRHSEIAAELLLGVAAALVSDDHHGLAVEPCPPCDYRGVVAEGP